MIYRHIQLGDLISIVRTSFITGKNLILVINEDDSESQVFADIVDGKIPFVLCGIIHRDVCNFSVDVFEGELRVELMPEE